MMWVRRAMLCVAVGMLWMADAWGASDSTADPSVVRNSSVHHSSGGGASNNSPAGNANSVRESLAGNLALSVTAGQFGSEPVYNFQLAFFPRHRLGLEATLAHNPSSGTHAALHHVGGVVPLVTWARLRPYAVAGMGTVQVFPGTAINAKSVTKLLFSAGGGAHLFLRDDVALRVEGRSFTVLDQQEEHRGTLGFAQWSVGLTFYRAIVPHSSDTGAAL